ncbi:putative serine dehydratase domain-containing protein [Endogone sp. FLAS-F59071]|nr:putative serine dehydratase domain-containing protein [Endogone sp. FLAS-F59071]|eukprot:RUS17116.1 putative serine dehydratase domain-containing protein [Endogone sp. FLAS-F59071]
MIHRDPHCPLSTTSTFSRAGVSTTLPNSLHLAQRIHTSPHTTFQGLYTHSGQSYASTSPLESLEYLHQERDLALSFRETLLASGIPVPHISIGATPSATAAAYEIGAGEDLSESAKSRWEGVTEIHAGNYIFMDRQQIQTRSVSGGENGCAATVLTRILSLYPDRKTLLIDAGALALSKDTAPQGGFGHVIGTGEKESGEGGWTLVKISQEHGIIEGPRTEEEWERVRIGEVVRVVPNHACLTTAGYPFYVVVEGGNREVESGGVRLKSQEAEGEELVIVDVWVPVRGW